MNPQLLMQPNEVPLGVVVFPCLPGEQPATNAPLCLLVGGVPVRSKWYPCDVDGGSLSAGYEYDALASRGVLLAPAKAYTAKDAPTGLKFAVFVDNKGVKYEQYARHYYVEVTRLSDGTFMSVCGYVYDHWLRRYKLPDNAILVPHGDCEYHKTIDDAIVLPMMYKGSDVWKMLAENGASFYRGTKWKETDPDEYYHVWLPLGWALLPDDKQFTSAKLEKVVDATGAIRARVVWVEQHYRDFHSGDSKVRKSGAVSLRNTIKLESGEIVW